MARVRQKQTKNQRRSARVVRHATQCLAQESLPLDDGTVTAPPAVEMIRALIPLGLKAVEDALLTEVTALAGPRYARDDARPEVVRWGAQHGSIYLADQKLPIRVPRLREQRERCEVPLATYAALQTPRARASAAWNSAMTGSGKRETIWGA